MKKLRFIFCLLFSTYFLVYVISPLSYTYKPWQADEQKEVSINDIKLFVVDLILSTFAKHKDSDKTVPPANILLKKKRATLSLSKLQQISEKIFKKNICAASQCPVLSYKLPATALQKDIPIAFKSYSYTSYSGLSPPFA